jgi:hypothetical protein
MLHNCQSDLTSFALLRDADFSARLGMNQCKSLKHSKQAIHHSLPRPDAADYLLEGYFLVLKKVADHGLLFLYVIK